MLNQVDEETYENAVVKQEFSMDNLMDNNDQNIEETISVGSSQGVEESPLNLSTREDFFEFTCPNCPRKFETKKHLNRHIRQLHRPALVKNLFCPYCGKGYVRLAMLEKHVYTHFAYYQQKIFCGICFEVFTNMDFLKGHMSRHFSNKRNACSYCPKTYVSHYNLRKHIESTHESQSNSREGEAGTSKGDDMMQFQHGESFLDAEGTFEDSWGRNGDNEEDDDFNIEEQFRTPPESFNIPADHPPRQEREEQQLCFICGMIFCDKDGLQRHEIENHSVTLMEILKYPLMLILLNFSSVQNVENNFPRKVTLRITQIPTRIVKD
ncbi:PR domain zinc finger protein 10-like [Lutzomyia longipalpis]|uniref:PR domain zinc finger protein 10-like n=1 Tax=Lutzomyia longipalpis TaxID=7200 RepID=UPI002483E621|nr:PR domain zinc finger protein 10-like [Lutzomyia longipalpis]